MIEVVEAIAAVGSAASAPAGSAQLLEQSAQGTGDMHQMSLDFDRMMQHQPEAATYNDALHNDHSTVATEFVKSGENVMRHTFSDVQRFIADAPNLAMPELTSRNVELSLEIAMTQFQFNASTYVAQSAKTGLQTLMKNQ